MLFALLEVSDFAVFALAIAFAAGAVAALMHVWLTDRRRLLLRLEHKIDLVMTHLGLDYDTSPQAVWQDLASDPTQRASAIKAYREQHRVELEKAQRAVEDYLAERGPRAAAAPPSGNGGRAGPLKRAPGQAGGRAYGSASADAFGHPWHGGSLEGWLG